MDRGGVATREELTLTIVKRESVDTPALIPIEFGNSGLFVFFAASASGVNNASAVLKQPATGSP